MVVSSKKRIFLVPCRPDRQLEEIVTCLLELFDDVSSKSFWPISVQRSRKAIVDRKKLYILRKWPNFWTLLYIQETVPHFKSNIFWQIKTWTVSRNYLKIFIGSGKYRKIQNFKFFSEKKGGQLEKTHFLGHVSARQTPDIGCEVFSGTFWSSW